jgi:membrane protein YdbS with pleckstrin-like domain
MTASDAHTGPTEPQLQAARKFYSGLWRVLTNLFKVPAAPPTLPAKQGEEIRTFKPDLGFLRYLKFGCFILNAILIAALFAGWIITFISLIVVELWWVGLLLTPLFILPPLIIAPVFYLALHLRYDTTWYVMTDRSLRIRRGIWTITETTITFENVQNMKISQGPLQRYFGISNLIVETAGSGGGDSKQQNQLHQANQGVIEGVAHADELRELILPRIRSSRSAGLGDEYDDAPTRRIGASPAWTEAHLALLREIRDAAVARSST